MEKSYTLKTENLTPNTCDLVAYANDGRELWRVQGKLEKDGKSYRFPKNDAGIVYRFTSVAKEGETLQPRGEKSSKPSTKATKTENFDHVVLHYFGHVDNETRKLLKELWDRKQADNKDAADRQAKLKELKKLNAKAAKLSKELGLDTDEKGE